MFHHSAFIKVALSLAFITITASMGRAQDFQGLPCRVVTWNRQDMPGFIYFQNGQPVELRNIQNSKRSQVFAYTGPATFPLYPLGTVLPTPEGQEAPQPLALVTLPASIQYPLILLVPRPEGQNPPFAAMVMDDDPRLFPFPSYQIMNLSKDPVVMMLGEHQFQIEPGQRRVLTSQQKTVNVIMAIPKPGTQEWKVVYDNFLPNWAEERSILFVVDLQKDGKNRVESRMILESKAAWTLAQEAPPLRVPRE